MTQVAVYKDNDFEKILAHYLSASEESTLTPFQQEKLIIWETAHELIKDWKTKAKAWPILSKRFAKDGKPLSRAQCYRHFSMADKVFSRDALSSQEIMLGMLIENNWDSYRRAIERKDSRAEAMILKNLENLSTKLKELEDRAANGSVQFVQINIVADPDAIGLPKITNLEAKIKALQQKKARKNLEAEEIGYEEQ